MKKRLRKKLHMGEFAELGFNMKLDVDYVDLGVWLDKIIDFTESRGLCIGGGHKFAFVCRRRGSCTDEDRLAYSEWLSSQPEVREWHISPLVDAWHSDPKNEDLEYSLPGAIHGQKEANR